MVKKLLALALILALASPLFYAGYAVFKKAALQKAAERGDAEAQVILGRMYDGQNYAKAVEWYRKAAEQGNADAQLSLGWMYMLGRGVPRSETDALEWFKKSAEQGNATAQYTLGITYNNAKDRAQARKWFEKAAAQGHVLAKQALEEMK